MSISWNRYTTVSTNVSMYIKVTQCHFSLSICHNLCLVCLKRLFLCCFFLCWARAVSSRVFRLCARVFDTEAGERVAGQVKSQPPPMGLPVTIGNHFQKKMSFDFMCSLTFLPNVLIRHQFTTFVCIFFT